MSRAIAGWIALGILAVATTPSMTHATCWQCAFDPEVSQWYCYSSAGEGAADCIPVSGDYCQLIGMATCSTDGCQCSRYPVIRGDTTPARLSIGVLLLHGRDAAAQSALVSALRRGTTRFEIGDDVSTPVLVAAAASAFHSKIRVGNLEVAGYIAATHPGLVTSRALGEDGDGFLVDARKGQEGQQHVRISQLIRGSMVSASHEDEIPTDDAEESLVRISGEYYACIVWARRVDPTPAGLQLAADDHERFIESADAYPVRRLATIKVDSPDLGPFGLFGPRYRPIERWGGLAVYYH